jgi:hypothetical protein
MKLPMKRLVLSGAALVMICVTPRVSFAQFGIPGVPGVGGGGGMPANFNQTITNSLKPRNTGMAPATGLYEKVRQENTGQTTKSKYTDSTFSSPLMPKITDSVGLLPGTRRIANRRSASSSDSSSSRYQQENPYRFPPGLREVKRTRKQLRAEGSSDPGSESARAELLQPAP